MLGWVLFIVGGLNCLLNAYLTWLRYPIHRLLGGTRDDYLWVSAIPLLGSGLMALAIFWAGGWHDPLRLWGGIALIAIDSGGPLSLLLRLLRRRHTS